MVELATVLDYVKLLPESCLRHFFRSYFILGCNWGGRVGEYGRIDAG